MSVGSLYSIPLTEPVADLDTTFKLVIDNCALLTADKLKINPCSPKKFGLILFLMIG